MKGLGWPAPTAVFREVLVLSEEICTNPALKACRMSPLERSLPMNVSRSGLRPCLLLCHPHPLIRKHLGNCLFIGMNASYLIVFCIFEGLKQASAPTVVDKEDVMNKSYRSKLYKNVQIALLQGNSILG